jgi:hypothetical protein
MSYPINTVKYSRDRISNAFWNKTNYQATFQGLINKSISGLEGGEYNVDGVIICIDSSEEHFFLFKYVVIENFKRSSTLAITSLV